MGTHIHDDLVPTTILQQYFRVMYNMAANLHALYKTNTSNTCGDIAHEAVITTHEHQQNLWISQVAQQNQEIRN